jgi:hypothetical protein
MTTHPDRDVLDLNAVRDIFIANARRGRPAPRHPSEKLFVTQDGGIVVGGHTRPDDVRPLAEVPQDVFTFDRAAHERAVVERVFPSNTRAARDGDILGWLYTIVNDLGRSFALWTYFHHEYGHYRVLVIAPSPPPGVDVHEVHVFGDGTLCLTPEVGCRTLEQAYAKSVLWTIGYDVWQQTGRFGFRVR